MHQVLLSDFVMLFMLFERQKTFQNFIWY